MRSLLLVLVVGVGCGGGGRSPVAAVRALGEAAHEGDVGEVMRRLGPRTRARLGEDARRAAEQAGRREVRPEELLGVGWTPPRYPLTDAREVERAGDHAVVEALGPHGERERVELVRERGEWKVELP